MLYSENEVLQYIEENDIQFIRLAFCDIFGELKNISIMSEYLADAFDNGVPFCPTDVKGFYDCNGEDLLLFPIPGTMTQLPWRPQRGGVVRFFCNVCHLDGRPFEGDVRRLLGNARTKLSDLGVDCIIGTDCEFYLFEADQNGQPTKIPQDNASRYDIAPRDKGENIRREICLTIKEMGISPERSYHEAGPGQNEIDFRYTSACTAADNFITFKTTVKTVAAKNGLFASFCPKPVEDSCGNGLHVKVMLYKDNEDIFEPTSKHAKIAEAFMEGVLRRVKEITLFLNPTTNSFKRFGSFEAPQYITWSRKAGSQLINIKKSSDGKTKMKLRSPDSACNPYFAFSLILLAGIEGIEKEYALRTSTDTQDNTTEKSEDLVLPASLADAIEAAKNSTFVRNSLPEKVLGEYFKAKQQEIEEYEAAVDKLQFENDRYFSTI